MQVVWRHVPTRRLTVGVGDHRVTVDVAPAARLHHRGGWSRPLSRSAGGPGSVVIGDLRPATGYAVWAEGPGMGRVELGEIRTLVPPPGALLARFATVSDTHIGETGFGLLGDIVDDPAVATASGPYPARCAAAALGEIRAWGSGLVVVKGDLTARSSPYELVTVRRLLVDSGLDCAVQLGNHDVRRPWDPAEELAGVACAGPDDIVVRDLPGVRVVLGHSPIFRDRPGDLDRRSVERLATAVGSAAGPAVVSLHHPPQRWPVPTSYPPGVNRAASRRLTSALRRANPATLVVAGHTHRNRRYRVDRLPVVEVGSTKDFPGGWAGYAVHEGGIRQVVRRTARPDVIAWTESTAAALGGQWGRWSPGSLEDRCWSMTWPSR